MDGCTVRFARRLCGDQIAAWLIEGRLGRGEADSSMHTVVRGTARTGHAGALKVKTDQRGEFNSRQTGRKPFLPLVRDRLKLPSKAPIAEGPQTYGIARRTPGRRQTQAASQRSLETRVSEAHAAGFHVPTTPTPTYARRGRPYPRPPALFFFCSMKRNPGHVFCFLVRANAAKEQKVSSKHGTKSRYDTLVRSRSFPHNVTRGQDRDRRISRLSIAQPGLAGTRSNGAPSHRSNESHGIVAARKTCPCDLESGFQGRQTPDRVHAIRPPSQRSLGHQRREHGHAFIREY